MYCWMRKAREGNQFNIQQERMWVREIESSIDILQLEMMSEW